MKEEPESAVPKITEDVQKTGQDGEGAPVSTPPVELKAVAKAAAVDPMAGLPVAMPPAELKANSVIDPMAGLPMAMPPAELQAMPPKELQVPMKDPKAIAADKLIKAVKVVVEELKTEAKTDEKKEERKSEVKVETEPKVDVIPELKETTQKDGIMKIDIPKLGSNYKKNLKSSMPQNIDKQNLKSSRPKRTKHSHKHESESDSDSENEP